MATNLSELIPAARAVLDLFGAAGWPAVEVVVDGCEVGTFLIPDDSAQKVRALRKALGQ